MSTARERLLAMGFNPGKNAEENDTKRTKYIKSEFKLWKFIKEHSLKGKEMVVVPIDPLNATIYYAYYARGKGYQPISKEKYDQFSRDYKAQVVAKVPESSRKNKPYIRIVMHLIVPACPSNPNEEDLVLVHEMSPTEYETLCALQDEEYSKMKKFFDKQGYRPHEKMLHMRRIPTGVTTNPYRYVYKTETDAEGRISYVEYDKSIGDIAEKMWTLEDYYCPQGGDDGIDEVIEP